jgi:hypothetical protein
MKQVDMSPKAIFLRIHGVFELEHFHSTFWSKFKPKNAAQEVTNKEVETANNRQTEVLKSS